MTPVPDDSKKKQAENRFNGNDHSESFSAEYKKWKRDQSKVKQKGIKAESHCNAHVGKVGNSGDECNRKIQYIVASSVFQEKADKQDGKHQKDRRKKIGIIFSEVQTF